MAIKQLTAINRDQATQLIEQKHQGLEAHDAAGSQLKFASDTARALDQATISNAQSFYCVHCSRSDEDLPGIVIGGRRVDTICAGEVWLEGDDSEMDASAKYLWLYIDPLAGDGGEEWGIICI